MPSLFFLLCFLLIILVGFDEYITLEIEKERLFGIKGAPALQHKVRLLSKTCCF